MMLTQLLRKVVRRLRWLLFRVQGSAFLPYFHPGGVTLKSVEVAPGCYALLADQPPVTNAGFVVGERGVLVVDAHINGAMARQIQDAVRAVTSQPILYLVNTSYHGDHTFGNYAFPAETQIVAHRYTAARMEDFDEQYEVILELCRNDRAVLADVKLRLPDVLFTERMELDLGGRSCVVHHFGHGNTSGDAVVWVPDAAVAYAGNLVSGETSLPVLRDGEARRCRDSLRRLMRELPVERIVPGHSVPSTTNETPPVERMLASKETLQRYLTYLDSLCEPLEEAVASGRSLKEIFGQLPLAEKFVSGLEKKEAMHLRVWHRFNLARCFRRAKTNQGKAANNSRLNAQIHAPLAPGQETAH